MSESLVVELRERGGKRENRRLRRQGSVPLVLYGHGQPNVNLRAAADQVRAVIRHGARVLDLQGAVVEKVFLRELQWDVYGLEVLHADLTRVSADERVEVKVPLELRGEAPGTRDGGVVEHLVHELEIDCLVIAIPEKLELKINALKLDDALTAGEVELPPGVRLVTPAETVVVQCKTPAEQPDEAEAGLGAAEPEVIGRKAAEDESSED